MTFPIFSIFNITFTVIFILFYYKILPNDNMLIMGVCFIYAVLLVAVVIPLDKHFRLKNSPIIKTSGRVTRVCIQGAIGHPKAYSVDILLENKKKVNLGISEEQAGMLNKNDIIEVVYQERFLRSFQRKTDKEPIYNKFHFPKG